MSYRIDPYDKSIVIEGFGDGIADSPFDGISDMRNVNIVSVPGEASVNFSTSKISESNTSGTVVSANAGADTINLTGLPGQIQAVTFSGGSLPAGVVAGTVYWVGPALGGGDYQLYTNYAATSVLNITGTGTGTWATVNMDRPKYFSHLVTPFVDTYFMVDALGRVWSNLLIGPSGFWRYTGNSITGTNGTAHGNGLVSYVPSNSNSSALGYVFVFRDFQIDYATINGNSSLTWTYGWKPSDATTGNNNYLKCATSGTLPNLVHESIVGPDNKVYYCDANYIGRWYQSDPAVGFVPTTLSTYTNDNTAVLPFTDNAQCLAPLGNNLLIGGTQNVVYPWDTFSNLPNYPIFIPEYNIVKLVTVNTNTFIFVGNRGRIYYTNGSQAQLFKKVPDHISGTVEPYYTWGGATSNKNQLYFSFSVTTNAGVAITQYGGLWAIDLDTKAIRLTNKLSYATYAGYASAIIPNFSASAAGTGLFIGWDSGVSTYGIDTTVSAPYSGSQAVIVSDLIPVGTFKKPRDFERIEYRLTKPMVSGESINIYARLIFNTTDTGFGSAILTDSTVGNFSSDASVNFKNAQWLQLETVLNSTASSPSYTRLKEIRITGVKE